MKGTQLKDYPGYSITENGKVYSYRQTKRRQLKQRVVSQSKKGYLQVSLYNERCKRNEKGQLLPKQVYVHRLVWKTFRGEIPKGKEIDHIDNNPRNNHIDNLQLVTRRNNMLKYNRLKFGKLSMDMIKEIREFTKQGYSIQQIADKLGKSYTSIYRVIHNKKQTYDYVNGKRYYYLIDFDYDSHLD